MSKALVRKLSLLENLTKKYRKNDLILDCSTKEKAKLLDLRASLKRMIKLSRYVFQEKNIEYNLKNLYESLESIHRSSNMGKDKNTFVFSTWHVSTNSAGYKSPRLRTSSPKGRPAFSSHAREYLELSFRANPAPTKFQCMEIKEKTKLSYEQVRTWFNNKRRRTKKDESGYFTHGNHYIVSINQFPNT